MKEREKKEGEKSTGKTKKDRLGKQKSFNTGSFLTHLSVEV
jgi:hypothetical protein